LLAEEIDFTADSFKKAVSCKRKAAHFKEKLAAQ